MKLLRSFSLSAFLLFSFFGLVWGFQPPVNVAFLGHSFAEQDVLASPPDTGRKDLPYPFQDRYSDPINSHSQQSGLYLNDPSNIKMEIEYNPEERQYDIYERIGNRFFRNPSYLTFDEYVEHEYGKSTKDYWKQRANEESLTQKRGFSPRLYIGGEAFNRIFGGNTIDIRPQGSAELSFGLNFSKYDNPTLPEKQRKNTTFDFREKIQLNVIGNIGEKLKLSTNYNTEASFDFENKLKLEYTGLEDEIIKKIEAGNVNLPLTGSLIQGSQSLFGIKTQLQFGRLTVTSVFSQQKGSTSTISVENGATTTPFDITADQYEANKHFFISQYFRNRYDAALSGLPFINSPVNITKIEVWRTNTVNTTTDNRNIVALLDLGETNFYNQSVPALINNTPPFNSAYPSDSSNSLYYQLKTNYPNIRLFNQAASVLSSIQGFSGSRDYEVLLNARKLDAKDYTFNRQLGYISLNQPLNPNDVLAVAFEYTVGNKVYRVGDLSTNVPATENQNLIVKLIKSKITNTSLPTWELMMKNIYALGAFQVERENFKLDVLYYSDTIGTRLNIIPTTPDDKNIYQVPLNRLMGLDKLNINNDQRPDGLYDFIEGVTINSANGRLIFPILEPFGSYLRSRAVNDTVANNYAFDILYDSTRAQVLQKPERNKFSIKGSFKSKSSSEISLNAFNILEGSVKVTAGGQTLVENQDYTVDYNLGKVKITNQSILQSNTKIDITVENNSLFSIQSRTMMGSRFDYVVNKDFTLGGTIIRLNERPITQKVNIGDEPISNTIWGVDGTYRTESRFLTKLVDKLPFISTKDPSNVTFSGEFANLIPGNNRAIGKKGVAYIDDFEGAQSTTDLKNIASWFISSTPSGTFPEGSLDNSLKYGFNRAKMTWYTIDPLFYRNGSNTPSNIDDNAISNHLVRQIAEKEIFPNKEAPGGQTVVLPIFDVSYYPAEKGPYNYEVGATDVSAGVNAADGLLKNPATRWGGIMRKVESSDFEATNTEFIQFWLMDPFNSNSPNTTGGELYFNLGNISEDVLKDNRKQFENGLPKTAAGTDVPVDTTQWGLVPRANNVTSTYSFDNSNADSRQFQDVGLDGLGTQQEQAFFAPYLNALSTTVTAGAFQVAQSDPSSDNFRYYNEDGDNTRTILERYKDYSQFENNSPVASSGQTSATETNGNQPDVEDINKDSNTETSEQYYEYKVELRPGMLAEGRKYIVDSINREVSLPNGNTSTITWYQFKIPVREPDKIVGGIEGFNSISFMRMYMTGFEQPVTMRFAKLEFLKGEWRKYAYELAGFEQIGGDEDETGFDVSSVSIEENGNRSPVNYVLPPGIDQELNIASTTTQRLNEQSLSFKVTNLRDGDAKGAFKTLDFDLRSYKRLKMYAHAEGVESADALRDGELTLFVRLGTDITENYYEYEIPLKVTQWGDNSREGVWPESNNLDLELEKLVQLKLSRNNKNKSLTSVYTEKDEGTGNNISIKGNPTLSDVRLVLIGVRNPKDNELQHSGEVWINELRLTDFDKKGGWATNARVTAKLANLGNVAIAGTHKSVGFGGVEQKVSERSKFAETSFNVSSTLYLGKFLPEKTGIDIPMYVNYGQIVKNPQYDPLNEDVEFKDALNNATANESKKEIKKRAQDYTRTKSINFTNVKKNKTGGGKSHIYDIENFNFTYGYDETYHRDINVEYDFTKTYRGAIGYAFNINPKGFSPFQKSQSLKSKFAKPIKDFNINFVPSSINFRTDIIRTYGEKLYRNNSGYTELKRDTFFNKNFEMRRLYDMKYDITKSLKFDIGANNLSVVDEPIGRIDTREERDSIKTNFWRFGRNRNYTHTGNLNYQVPLNKFPLTDWISLNAKYGFNYGWTAGQFVLDSANSRYGIDERTGNTIQNSNTRQLNGNFTMTQLYNKVPFLKKINSPKPKAADKNKAAKEQPKIAKPEDNKMPADSSKVAEKPKEKKKREMPDAVRFVGKMLMGVKTLGFSYSENNGTILPGYRNYSQVFGQDLEKNSPGLGFAFGSQKDLRNRALQNEWITPDTSFNQLYTRTYTQNISLRGTIEPITGLKIELTGTKTQSRNNAEFFRYNGSRFESQNAIETGSFSISFLSFNSAFVKDDDITYTNSVFEEFIANRKIISQRLAALNPDNSIGFAPADSFGVVYNDGYGGTQQEVLTLAFLAAYSGKSAESIDLNPFIKIPKPNWRITYDGLSKLPLLKKIFNNVTLTHSYRSAFNINNYGQNLLYSEQNGFPSARDFSDNIIAKKEITQISISEQFGPLIGVDVTWKNNIQTRIEYKKDRNLSLSFVGTQLTEVKGNEVVFGFGYRLPKFNLPKKIFGSKRKASGASSNSLNLTADLSVRRNITIIRKMLEGINQPTAGLNVFSMKAGADYAVNERLNVRLFFETTSNTPVVSTSYPTTNTSAGIAIRFSLAQ